MVLAVDFTRGPLLPLRLSIVNHWTSVTTCSSRHSSPPGAQNHFIWINVWSQPVREQSRQHWQARTNQPGEQLITVITSKLCQSDQSWERKYKPPQERRKYLSPSGFQIFKLSKSPWNQSNQKCIWWTNICFAPTLYLRILSAIWTIHCELWFTYCNVCSLVTDRQCWC